MPTVLILGATGYFGLPLAKSLLRSGDYTVYGLARSPAKAKTLVQNEIIPLIGDVSDPSSFTHLISSAPIDVVIDTTSAYEGAGALFDVIKAASKSRITTLTNDGSSGPKLGFVYVSGTWVHGNQDTPTSDTIPPGTSLAKGKPATAAGWRPAHEQAILASRDVLDVAIVRPSQMYGGTSWIFGTHFGPLFAAAKSGSSDPIAIPADSTARPNVVHVDDVVSGVHAVTDRIHGLLGTWPVFDFVGETILLSDILEGAKRSLGVKAPLHYAGTQGNPFLEALGLTTNNQSSRASVVLGWRAKRGSFVQNLDIYVKAWVAAQPEEDAK